MRRRLAFLVSIAFVAASASAQQRTWVGTVKGSDPMGIVPTATGAVVGINDVLAVVSSDGKVTSSSECDQCAIQRIAPAADGVVAVMLTNSGDGNTFGVARFSAEGAIRWSRTPRSDRGS